MAASFGNLEVLKDLHQRGINIDTTRKAWEHCQYPRVYHPDTPLQIVCESIDSRHNTLEIANFLLHAGADYSNVHSGAVDTTYQ